MKVLIILCIFIGMFLVVKGVYEQKLNEYKSNPKIEYKFIPRTYYEEQIYGVDNDNIINLFKSSNQPWFQTSSPFDIKKNQ